MQLISAEDYTQFPNVQPDFTYFYGDDPQQFGDLYLPEGDSVSSVIVLVHGGCWREQYSLKPMGNLCKALTQSGLAVWSIEYRRAGNGGNYPNTFLDVASAVDYLPQIADKHSLNLDNVYTVGHSAGGQLAVWLAGRHKIPTSSVLHRSNPLSVKGVVALAGIVDLIHAMENDMCKGALSVIMGGDAQSVPDHYDVASPRALLPIGVPQTHIVGEHDTEILANVKPYIQSAQQAGDTVDLIIAPNAGHFEIVTTSSDTWQLVLDAILAMVRQ